MFYGHHSLVTARYLCFMVNHQFHFISLFSIPSDIVYPRLIRVMNVFEVAHFTIEKSLHVIVKI